MEGTFYYWAGPPKIRVFERVFDDAMLSGAFVVDLPGAAPLLNERILVLGSWLSGRHSASEPDFGTELNVINGRPS